MRHLINTHIKPLIILIAFVLLINASGYLAAQDEAVSSEKEVKKIFQEAKKAVYNKEWQKAVEQFKTITENFSKSQWADESLYWLAYSLNKMAENLQNLEEIRDINEQALKNLDTLKQQYPTSQWIDDARRLTVEIAEEMVAKGLKAYKKYIIKGIKEDDDIEMKLVALDALMHMDKEKAFPMVQKIIQNSKIQEMRAKAIYILAQLGDPRVIPLLKEVALKDSDSKVKEQAIFWLGEIRSPESRKQLLKIYHSAAEADVALKKKIIFSISQSGEEKAIKALINIYKKEKNVELKKQIVFWLGSSSTKEAQEFILKILE
jgi:outer membrane protein assembly factor BamD (BamD/ComL family)